MTSKIGIVYSSFNNYEILKGEVLRRIDFNGFPVINIDDHSDPVEQEKGRLICAENGIEYQVNTGKGLQCAVDQGIKYLSAEYGCEWIFCLQQDVFPVEDNFFSDFKSYIDGKDLDDIGAIGFNVLDNYPDNSYSVRSYDKYLSAGSALGSLGIFFFKRHKIRLAKAELILVFNNKFFTHIWNKKI